MTKRTNIVFCLIIHQVALAQFSFELDLSNSNGQNGFIINGKNAGDELGYSVSSAGDVNGDGVDDLIIGAFSANPNDTFGAGKSYIVFGSKGDKVFKSPFDGFVCH